MGFTVEGQWFRGDEDGFDRVLRAAYAKKIRPLCDCLDGGVPMYLAMLNGGPVVKRMPNGGQNHHHQCASYEPPSELSGKGEVLGSAIEVDPSGQCVSLRLDFSLNKQSGRKAPQPGSGCSDTVEASPKKLTLRSLFDYLWDEAEFNRWVPAMRGRRHWSTIRRFVMEATQGKSTKGKQLADLLFVPEPFVLEQAEEIKARRNSLLYKIAPTANGSKELLIVVAEVKEIAKSRYGYKMVCKHLPDMPLMMDDEMHRKVMKRFAKPIEMWSVYEQSHLLAIGTFHLTVSGTATLDELALVSVDEQWLPYEDAFEKQLIDGLVQQGRSFFKGLRYNLGVGRVVAAATLTDLPGGAVGLYILRPGASEEERDALEAVTTDSPLKSWIWDAGADGLPTFPE